MKSNTVFFFYKIHRIDKPLAMVTKDKTKNTPVSNVRDERVVTITDQEMTLLDLMNGLAYCVMGEMSPCSCQDGRIVKR